MYLVSAEAGGGDSVEPQRMESTSCFVPPPPCLHQPPSFLHTITTTTSIRRGLLTRRRASGNDDGELIDGVVKNTAVACILGSSGTLWSEFSVATTGCGPATLSDVLERGCYYSAFGLAAVSVFTRIAFGLSVMESLDRLLDNTDLLPLTSLQVKIAESLALAAVGSAMVVLLLQIAAGVNIWDSGLTGIDRFACRAAESG